MDPEAAALLDRVRADLEATGGPRLRLLDEPATSDPGTPSFWLSAVHGMRTGVAACRVTR